MQRRKTKNQNLTTALLAVMLLGFLSLACSEPKPTIYVSGTNTPTFSLEGENLTTFIVSGGKCKEIDPSGIHGNTICWLIRPTENCNSANIKDIGPIIYGKIPKTFKQIFPKNREPMPLEEGLIYRVTAVQPNLIWETKCFAIRGGKAVEIFECE
jgi:hypothetical protein